MNQKGFINIWIVVLVVIVAGVLGYFTFVKKSEPVTKQTSTTQIPPPVSTQTSNNQNAPTPQNETANWKVYRSEKYRFELRYPPSLQINEEEPVLRAGDLLGESQIAVNDFSLTFAKHDLELIITSRQFIKTRDWRDYPVLDLAQWDFERSKLMNRDISALCPAKSQRYYPCRIIEQEGILMVDKAVIVPPGAAEGRKVTFYQDDWRYDFMVFSSDLLNNGEFLSFEELDNLPEDSLVKIMTKILSTFKFVR